MVDFDDDKTTTVTREESARVMAYTHNNQFFYLLLLCRCECANECGQWVEMHRCVGYTTQTHRHTHWLARSLNVSVALMLTQRGLWCCTATSIGRRLYEWNWIWLIDFLLLLLCLGFHCCCYCWCWCCCLHWLVAVNCISCENFLFNCILNAPCNFMRVLCTRSIFSSIKHLYVILRLIHFVCIWNQDFQTHRVDT